MRGGAAYRASARREHWLPPRWAERPRAYAGPFPITAARTLAQVDRDEADLEQNSPPLLPLPAAVGSGAPAQLPPAAFDEIECRANAGDEGAARTAAVEPVSRPAAGRSAAATSELMDVTAGETAPSLTDAEPGNVGTRDDDPRGRGRSAVTSGQAVASPSPERLAARTETYGEIKRPPKVDWGRVAEAAKRQTHVPPAARAKVLQPALSKDPCRRCGVPGFRGCDHQLPYDEAAL